MILSEISVGNEMGLRGWLCSSPAEVITIPEQGEDLDFCACLFTCEYVEPAFVLSTDETDTYKNDYRSFLINLRDATSSYSFTLVDSLGVETILVDDTYGKLFDVGFNNVQPLIVGYRIDWFKVWENLGYGEYFVKISQIDFGNEVTNTSNKFNVIEFSESEANKTVKLETIQTGVILNGQDFGGMQWVNMVRINGTFGNIEPNYEINRLQDSSRTDIDIQTEYFNKYTLTAEMIPVGIGKQLLSQDVMTDKIFISNYDVLAYDQFRKLPVVFDGSIEAGSDYVANDKKNFTISFKDSQSLLKRNFV